MMPYRNGRSEPCGFRHLHREGTAQQMPHAFGKGSIIRTVEDGENHINTRNHDIAHNSVSGNVEMVGVVLGGPQEQVLE